MKNVTQNRERAKLLLAELEAELEVLEAEDMNRCAAGYGGSVPTFSTGYLFGGVTGGFFQGNSNGDSTPTMGGGDLGAAYGPTGLGDDESSSTYPQYGSFPTGYYSNGYGEGPTGDGTKNNPYTQSEYNRLHTDPSFKGGWVKDANGSMYFGYKSGNRQTDMNDHWEKEGKNDMKNCSGCACGRSAKAAPGDPKGGPHFGQLGAHSKYHKNEYYNHYGECEQDRKRPKSILERVLDNL